MIRVLTLLVGASALIPQSPTPHRRPARRGPPTAMRGGGFLSNILGGKGEDDLKRSAHLMWSEYEVPDDCAGWLYSFASVAETFPAVAMGLEPTQPKALIARLSPA